MLLGVLAMALSKYKLGELIQFEGNRNTEGKFTLNDVLLR